MGGPLLRLTLLVQRLVRRPPSRPVTLVMLVALLLAIGLVVIEKTIGWPEALRTERVPMHRMAP